MARKPDDWMPLHIGEYHADTSHLTRDMHGAYFLLLMAYWRRGGPLPADDGRLAATAKATATEWRKLRPVLAEFFTERDGHWHQKRADAELAKATRMTEAKALAGKKGADKRWRGDDGGNSTAMAEPSPSHRQSDAPLPSPKPEEDTSLRSVSSPQAELQPAQSPGTSKPKKPGKPDKTAIIVDFPDWWPHENWRAFLEMRRSIRATMGPDAIKLAVQRLGTFRAEGHDVAAILDQSTMNSYKGLFPVKRESTNNDRKPAQQSFGSSIARAVDARRTVGGMFGDRGAEIIVPAGASHPAGDREENRTAGRTSDAA